MLVPREIFNLQAVADTEASQYALDGVRFYRTNGKPMACATDGRVAIITQWDEDDPSDYPPGVGNPAPNGGEFAAIVSIDACKRIPKMGGKRMKSKRILRNIVLDEHSFDGNMLGVGATDLNNPETASIRVLDGRYPQVHNVIPQVDEECTSIVLNGKLLLGMLQTFTKLVEDQCTITFTVRDHKSAVLMTAQDNGIRMVGVIMPLLGDDEPKPGWLPDNK